MQYRVVHAATLNAYNLTLRSMLEQREMEAVVHVKESMQIAEDALMEKERAVVREQQSAQEIVRLKKALEAILQEAGVRTRNEVCACGSTVLLHWIRSSIRTSYSRTSYSRTSYIQTAYNQGLIDVERACNSVSCNSVSCC